MITYSASSDALYVYFTEDGPNAKAARTVPLDDNRVVDYAEDGSVLGLELLGVSQGIDLEGLPERAKLEEELKSLRRILDAVPLTV